MNKTQVDQNILAPVVKSVSVRLPVEAAFSLFTEKINQWWPLKTHSVWGNDAMSCHIEGWVGGRFYEVNLDGLQSDWGVVREWEPPHKVVFSFNPGRSPATAQQVEVLFQPEANGTRVTLTHTGWELLGENASKMRDNYEQGWNGVLNQYVICTASGGVEL